MKPSMGQLYSLRGLWREHPLYQGIVGHWLFNEGGGLTAYDLSVHGRHGTLTNGPVWRTGKFGRALLFDGVDSYVSIGDTLITGPPFSITGWFNSTDDATSQVIGAIADNTSTNDFHSLHIRGDAAGDPLAAHSRDGTNFVEANSPTGYSLNTWHFGCGVWKATNNRKVYLDVVNTAENTVDVTPSPLNTLELGRSSDASPSFFFDGRLDDIRFYNRALSVAEIESLFHDPFLPFRWASEQVQRSYFDLFVAPAAPAAGPPVGSLSLVGAGR